MKIKQIESTVPCPVGITISGCKGNFYTGNGSRYAYIAGSNSQAHDVDKIVATTNPYVNSEYLRMYPGKLITRSNQINSANHTSYEYPSNSSRSITQA
jgi:hypothetical protein